MDFDIGFYNVGGQRGAYRATIPGLAVRLPCGTTCAARDISAGGVGFTPPEDTHFSAGQVLMLDFLVADHLFIQGLESVVVRASSIAVACSFRQLSRVQETKLDKLVLETQKRLIARRKAEEARLEQEEARREQEEAARATAEQPEEPITIDLSIDIK